MSDELTIQSLVKEAREESQKMRDSLMAWGDWLATSGGTPEESEALDVALSRMPPWAIMSPPEPRKAPAKGAITNLQGDDMIAALEAWGGLACRGRYPSPEGQYDPLKVSGHIEHWADLVLQCAHWAEGLDTPTARITRWHAATELTWKGQWTEGRWLTVRVKETTGPGSASCASITWDSGTGEPSTFLGGILGRLLDQVEVTGG